MIETYASFYGLDPEKEHLNEHVAMIAREICHECKGSGKKRNDNLHYMSCKRCNADGYLDNQVKFNPDGMACASNMHPLGTWLKVTNESGASIVVLVIDRGPGKEDRESFIDLTVAAFRKLSDLNKGIIKVQVEVL